MEDPDIDTVVEVMGGTGIAKEVVSLTPLRCTNFTNASSSSSSSSSSSMPPTAAKPAAESVTHLL